MEKEMPILPVLQNYQAITPNLVLNGYVLKAPLAVTSAEADLWLAYKNNEPTPFLVKIYRHGITSPNFDPTKFEHPNVLKTLETGTFAERYFEIVPFIAHGQLKSDTVKAEHILPILEQLAHALQYLHTKGIQHRDIKPANILIAEIDPPQVLLSDFGAASAQHTTALTNARGTLLYSAPEALAGTYTKASDWFSIGMLLWELIEGQHPLNSLPAKQQHFALASGNFDSYLEHLSHPLAPVVSGLLHPDYTQRWKFDEILEFIEEYKLRKNGNPASNLNSESLESTQSDSAFTTAKTKSKKLYMFLFGGTLAVILLTLSFTYKVVRSSSATSSPNAQTLTEQVSPQPTQTQLVTQDTQKNTAVDSAVQNQTSEVLKPLSLILTIMKYLMPLLGMVMFLYAGFLFVQGNFTQSIQCIIGAMLMILSPMLMKVIVDVSSTMKF